MAFNTTRWTLANILPVLFVLKIILSLWMLYVFLHLVPLLQDSTVATHERGLWQTVVSQSVTAIMLVCFLRAIATDPGSVPQTPTWQLGPSAQKEHEAANGPQELKQTGEPRFCKWCNQFKPDRCHHCRVCRSCILRMDHHCPWIANCVGFRNHKFFLLLVFYAMVNCLLIFATMMETFRKTVEEEMTPLHRFGIVYCMTLAALMSLLLVPFFLLHISFMLKSQSTIEYCEKRTKNTQSPVTYDLGVLDNMRATLGPYIILWLLPISPPAGDGVHFETRKVGGEDLAAPLASAEQASGSSAQASQPEVTGHEPSRT